MGKAFLAAIIVAAALVIALRYSAGFRAWMGLQPVTV